MKNEFNAIETREWRTLKIRVCAEYEIHCSHADECMHTINRGLQGRNILLE